MKKILCIVGTRPQLIKHSVLIKHLQKSFAVETINTAQHYNYELNDIHINGLYTQPTFHQLTLKQNIPPAKRLGEMITGLSNFLESYQPDAVLVYGDTDTTLAGALAANKWGVKLVHVEAGERSHNKAMPEEVNRVITDTVADILFCASVNSLENLNKENNIGTCIYSGDIMKDLALQTAKLFQNPLLDEDYFFCTIHRNYNKNNPAKLTELLKSLASLQRTVIFPLHPATLKTVEELNLNKEEIANIRFLQPVKYLESIHYQKFAKAVITDSGGIQKEAYWLKRPCITVRRETEWIETLRGNWNTLVYDDLSQLSKAIVIEKGVYDAQLYGNGNAGAIILDNLVQLI